MTDHNFTGEKQDDTGLMYYRSRYYDPAIGAFISPDTIVPDAGLVSDYNRYMMVRGNPLRFSDPTGHCAMLEDGGPDLDGDQGCWDAANEWLKTFGSGGYETVNDWQRYFAGQEAMTEDIFRTVLHDYWAPQYRSMGVYHHRYNPPPQMHPVTTQDQAFEQFHAKYAPDCNEIDCVTHSLDALGAGAAVVALGCAAITWGACGVAASAVGIVSGATGVGWTAYQLQQGNSTEVDLLVTGTTLTIGAAKNGNPYVGLGASLFQWGWDYANPMSTDE